MNIFSRRRHVQSGLTLLAVVSACLAGIPAQARELPKVAAAPLPAGSTDRGALPGSQPISVTLYLTPLADRVAGLAQFLDDVQSPGSASYHAWVTPAQFGQRFGATAAQLGAVQAFAAANGLSVGSVSPAGLRVSLSGSVSQVEAAMAPGLRSVEVNGKLYFANTAGPSLPDALAGVVAVDGLSSLPEVAPLSVSGVVAGDSLAGVAGVVDANVTRVLVIGGAACVEDVDAGTQAAMQMELRQAAAQGITVLAASGCGARGAASYPAGMSEALSVAVAPGISPAVNAVLSELRPEWQTALGLPSDGFRHEPDVTVSSLDAMSQAVAQILRTQDAGAGTARLGNIDAVLYRMAQMTDVFSQPDGAAVDTWEAATGLGNVDLAKFDKQFPRPNAGLSSSTQLHLSGGGTHGTTLTIYATVADTSGSNGSPTGTVTLTSNPAGLNCGPLNVANGTSTTCTTNQLPAASYTFTATYTDQSGTYAGSTGTASLTIQPEDSGLTASASGTATFGSTFTVTVTDRSPSGVDTPTGTINIVQNGGGGTIPSQPLTSTQTGVATATFQIPATQAGSSISYTVTCSSTNQSFTCNTPYQLSMSIQKATPTGTLGVSPSAPVYGTATSFTQTFAGPVGYTQPTGYSQVNENGQYVTSATLANGTATSNSSTVSGTVSHTFVANYQGDNNYNAATATASTTGTKIVTTLSVTAPSKTAVVTGTGVALNAVLTLASAPAGLTPTGTVQFYANGQQVGQAVNVSGLGSNLTVTLSYVALPVGSNVISAVYTGDTNYTASSSANTNETVLVGPATTITLASSATNNVAFGGSVNVTATVAATPTSGASTLTGSIIFQLSGGGLTTPLTQTIALTSSTATAATAVATFSMLTAGSYSLTATCATVNFDCSNVTSNAVTVTVGKAATTTTLTANPSSPTAGQSVTLTATVTMTTPVTGLTPMFTGTVTFYDNGASLGSPSVSAAGVATLVTALAGTNDTVTAVYSGDSNFLTSTGTLTVTQMPVTTSTTVTANTTLALAGSNIILSASVSDAPSGTGTTTPATPSGTVTFYDTYNGQMIPLGTAPLTTTGPYTAIGQITTTGLKQGTHSITAVFGTNSSFVGSTSNALVVNITDYSVSFSPGTLTVNRGSNATAIATITALNSFNGQVVLGCTPPAGTATTCTFTPAVINANGFPATSQLLITTTPGQAGGGIEHAGVGRTLAETAFTALLLGLLLPSVRRRRPVLMAMVLSCLVLGAVGCTNLVNTGSQSGPVSTGTPLGTQIFTITTSGTDGRTTTQHNTQFQVTVQ